MHLLITVLIIVFGLYFTFQKPSNRINNVYIIICGLLLIVQAGFREIDLVHMKNSNDTIRYYYMFQDMKNISFGTLLSKFSLVAKDYYSRDMGYSVLVKLFQLFSTDFRTFLVLIAFIITTPLCFIIRIFTPPHIRSIMLAFLVYQALFAGFFETGIRQTIAMGFVLSSINFVLKKNIVPFVICILIAYTIHSTAIFFVPLLLIHFIREYRKVLLVTLLCSPVLMSFVSTIIGYISQGTVYEGYASQRAGAGTPVFSAFLYLVAILYYWFYPKIQEETEYGGDLLSLAVMFAVLLMPLSWVNPNYLRLTFYFTSFFLAIIPLIVESVTRQIPQIRPPIYIGITILLVCLKFLK